MAFVNENVHQGMIDDARCQHALSGLRERQERGVFLVLATWPLWARWGPLLSTGHRRDSAPEKLYVYLQEFAGKERTPNRATALKASAHK